MKSTSTSGETRPWGYFVVLEDAPNHKVKRIVVRPAKRLSYQLHRQRAEHWFIIHGRGRLTLAGVEREVQAGDAIDIAKGTAHRIENVGQRDLVLIEVQHGEYFGEDDIERLEDDYGRA